MNQIPLPIDGLGLRLKNLNITNMNNEKLLRLSLKANVIFSILSGLAAVFLGTSSKAVLEMASGNAGVS